MRVFLFLLFISLIIASCKKEKCSKSELLFTINTEDSDYEKSGHIFLTDEEGNIISVTSISENKTIYNLECEEKHIPGKINLHFISREADVHSEINISSFLNIQSGNYDAEFNFNPFQSRVEYVNHELKWEGDTTNMEFIYCTTPGLGNSGHLENFGDKFYTRTAEDSPIFVGVKYTDIDTLFAGLVELDNSELNIIDENNLSHSFFLHYGETLISNPLVRGDIAGTFECNNINSIYHALGYFLNTEIGSLDYRYLSFHPQDIFQKYITNSYETNSSFPSSSSIRGRYYTPKLIPTNFNNEISFFDCIINEENQIILEEANAFDNKEVYKVVISTDDDENLISIIGNSEELSNYELPELPKEIKSEYPEFSYTNPKKEIIIRYATEMPIGLQGFYDLSLKTNRSKNECDYFDIAGEFSTQYQNKN